jgi:predicted DNA-binding protein (MmcQ/YjbR family)
VSPARKKAVASKTAKPVGMTEAALRKLALAWPATDAGIKWEGDLVFTVDDRMFCCLCVKGEEKGKLSFKVEGERFLELTDRPGFRPAPYLARAQWVTLDDPAVIGQDELRALLRRAYELVVAKLSKKRQKELCVSTP